MEEKKILEHYCAEDPDLDCNEEIWVYPNYIQYNTWCWPFAEYYIKLEYKVEWKFLLVRAIDYIFNDPGYDLEWYRKFHFIKDWELDLEETKKFTQWCVDECKAHMKEERKQGNNSDSEILEVLEYADDIIADAQDLVEWHEFKTTNDYTRYSTNAKKRIIEKIKNKDFN